MENENKALKANQYIFFLKLNNNLTDSYFYLAQMFLLYDYTLVPICLSELKDLMSPKKQYVLSLSMTIEERKFLKRIQKQYLDHAILRDLINFYDVSSFTSLHIQNLPIRRLNYFYHALPSTLYELVSEVSNTIDSEREIEKKWPGGRRPRLPKMLQGT